MEYDEEYVQALEKQADYLAHHLQLVTDPENSSLVDGICKMDANKAVKSYFEFKTNNSND